MYMEGERCLVEDEVGKGKTRSVFVVVGRCLQGRAYSSSSKVSEKTLPAISNVGSKANAFLKHRAAASGFFST